MNHSDPSEVGSAKLKLIEAIDKLKYARDSLMMQQNHTGPRRAEELQTLILVIETILERV